MGAGTAASERKSSISNPRSLNVTGTGLDTSSGSASGRAAPGTTSVASARSLSTTGAVPVTASAAKPAVSAAKPTTATTRSVSTSDTGLSTTASSRTGPTGAASARSSLTGASRLGSDGLSARTVTKTNTIATGTSARVSAVAPGSSRTGGAAKTGVSVSATKPQTIKASTQETDAKTSQTTPEDESVSQLGPKFPPQMLALRSGLSSGNASQYRATDIQSLLARLAGQRVTAPDNEEEESDEGEEDDEEVSEYDEDEDDADEDEDEDMDEEVGSVSIASPLFVQNPVADEVSCFAPTTLLYSIFSDLLRRVATSAGVSGIGSVVAALRPPKRVSELNLELPEHPDILGQQQSIEDYAKLLTTLWIHAASQAVSTSKFRKQVAEFVEQNLCIAAALHPVFAPSSEAATTSVSTCCRSCQSRRHAERLAQWRESHGLDEAGNLAESDPLLVGMSFAFDKSFRSAAGLANTPKPRVEDSESGCARRQPGCFSCVQCALEQGLCARCCKVVSLNALSVPDDGALMCIALLLFGTPRADSTSTAQMLDLTRLRDAIKPALQRSKMAPALAAARRATRGATKSRGDFDEDRDAEDDDDEDEDEDDGLGSKSKAESKSESEEDKVPTYDDDHELETSTSEDELDLLLPDDEGEGNSEVPEETGTTLNSQYAKPIEDQIRFMLHSYFARKL